MGAKLNLKYYTGKDYYSDGDIELKIYDIVKNNLNHLEQILEETKDWALIYHLSPLRHNLLKWYNFNKNGYLLEIGAGCGALTTLFVDKVKFVTAIELSKRRSEIVYYRCKEAKNLEIIVGNFENIKLKRKYDYITLIGVLEYAAKFFKTDSNPFLSMLRKVKNLLKENGTLIIAIENEFGIKYFSGSPEDHTGNVFEGLEGYTSSDIRTFGKDELINLILDAGFKDINFYYPYPDYKFPFLIYSDEYMPDVASLFENVSLNLDRERSSLFNENKVMSNLLLNSRLDFFANSFLIEVKNQ